jgi:transcription antitermination factor NusG
MPRWYAVLVKSQHERAVARDIEALGYEAFVPLYRSERRWSDRIKTLQLPFFPQYAFGRFPFAERTRVENLPGVRCLITFGKRAAPIPDEEIQALKAVAASGLVVQPWPFLEAGDRVRIERGPLRGVEGIVQSVNKSLHLVVSVEMLKRSVAVKLERDMVTPAGR